MFKKRVLFLLVLFLCMPSVLAFQLSDAKLFWGNSSVEYYSDNNPVTVNLELMIGVDDLSGIVVDLSDLNNNYEQNPLTSGYGALDISRALCTQEGDSHKCLFRNLILRKSNPLIEIVARRGGEVATTNITLQRSTANPKVTFIGTEGCHDGKCYAKSGFNFMNLIFEGSDAGFSRGMIGFGTRSYMGNIIRCNNNECRGAINLQCQDGQELLLSLMPYRGSSSADDAGIAITGPYFSLICDSKSPVVQNLVVVPSRDVGVTEISESFRVVANISEDVSPVVSMKVIGDDVNSDNVSGTCALRDRSFHCSASVSAAVSSRGLYDVPVIFTDLAGNEVRDVVSVELVEVEREEVPNFWRSGSIVQSSDSMNVRNLGYERTFFVEVPLLGGAELLSAHSRKGSCVPVEENKTGNKGDISKFDVLNFDKESNKVYLRMGLRPTGLSNVEHRYSGYDRLEYSCELDVQSKFAGFFYSEPEIITFNIVIELDDRDTLTEKVYHEIEASTKRYEANMRFTNSLDSKISRAMNFCQGFIGAESFGGAVNAAGTALEGAIPGAGGLLVDTGGFINRLTKEQLKKFAEVCKYLTCQTNFIENDLGFDFLGELDNIIPYQAEVSGWLGRESQSDFFNPYNSEYVAYATQCVPAIIHHRKVKQTIECTYLDCITSGITDLGQSISYCESERAYSSCVYTTQGILNALPVINMFRDASQRFSEAISNPYNLFGFAAPIACSLMPSGPGLTLVKGACLAPVFIQNIGTFVSVVDGIADQIDNSNQVDPASQCSAPMSAANRVISANLQSQSPVGNFPEGFSFDYNERVAGNLYLSYDDDASEFALVRGVGEDSSVVGYVSPSDIDFSSGSPSSNSFNIYSEEGRLLGEVNSNGFSSVHVDEYNGLLADLDRYNAERAKIISGLDLWEDDEGIRAINEVKLEAISELIENTEQEIENNDVVGLGELFNNSVSSGLYSNVHSANRDKFNALVDKYPFMEDYFQEEWELAQAHSAIRDENQPAIDALSDAATGIGYFNRDDNIFEELNKMNSEYSSQCSEDSNSRYCRRLGDKINSYERAADICDEYGVDDCNRANMNSIAKDLDKDVSAARSEANKKRRQNLIETRFDDHFGSFNSAIRTAWGVSHGMTMVKDLTSSLGADSSDFARHTALGQASEWFGDAGSGDWGICASNLEPFEQVTGGIAVKAGEAGYRAGVYLVARKSAVQEGYGEEPYYDYWIEGAILTSKGGELGYRIFMQSDKGKLDVTELVVGKERPVVRAGTPEKFGGLGKGKTFIHREDFNRVCLEFTTSNLRDYFDVVQISGRTICQTLKRE